MNFINTKHYDKKRKALLDQDGYSTSDFINRVPDLEPDDDYLLLDKKIQSQGTSIATTVANAVSTVVATDTVNTKLAATPLDVVTSQNQYIRFTGSAASGVTIEAKATNNIDTSVKYTTNGVGEHIFQNSGTTQRITLSRNKITLKDSNADDHLLLESKGGATFTRVGNTGSNYIDVIPGTGSGSTLKANGELILQSYNTDARVSIPQYLSLGGLGYYYGELAAGAFQVTDLTFRYPEFGINTTNTFTAARVRWQNGLGLHNNTAYTITLLCHAYWGTNYTPTSSNHINVDTWFACSSSPNPGEGLTKWGHQVRHFEAGEFVSGLTSAVIQLAPNSHIRFVMYSNPLGVATNFNIYGYEETYGLYIGNNKAYFTAQQLA